VDLVEGARRQGGVAAADRLRSPRRIILRPPVSICEWQTGGMSGLDPEDLVRKDHGENHAVATR
jgi:hypothetical protein